MIVVRVYLSESEHDDALIVGLKPATLHSVGLETSHSFVEYMTRKWYDLFAKWIKEDGHAGKLRDSRKCDLTVDDVGEWSPTEKRRRQEREREQTNAASLDALADGNPISLTEDTPNNG